MGIIRTILFLMVMEDFFSSFLEKKEQKKTRYYSVWILYFIYHMVVMVRIDGPVGNLVFNVLFLLFLIEALYVGNWKIKIIANLLCIALSCVTDMITAILTLMIQGNLVDNYDLWAILAKILYWIAVRVFVYMGKDKMRDGQNGLYLSILGLISCFTILCAYIIVEMDLHINSLAIHNWTLILSVIILILDVVSFKVYNMLLERWELKKENENFMFQIELCNRQIKERQAIMNDIRRTRHDMKNQMFYLKRLMKDDREKAEEFLDQYMDENMEIEKELSMSGNLVIDSLINYKCTLALEKQMKVNVSVNVPEELPYQSADLCIIIGNLLDNAIEAAENVVRDPYIDLSLSYKKERLVLSIKNNYAGEIRRDKNGNFVTHKKDAQNHAVGLRSVQRCVDKNNGKMSITVEAEYFEVDVML